MAETMLAALLDAPGKPFRLDRIAVPEPGPGEVLVEVAAAGLIPNMRAVVSGKEWYTLPPQPAVYGLDAAGRIAATGSGVYGFAAGDRVYVNPALHCGACGPCSRDETLLCDSFSLRGYFSTGPHGDDLQRRYPYGAFSQYLIAPVASLVRLSDRISYAQAARFGYLGTSYHALKVAGIGPGEAAIVNGVTGTLGVGAVQLARAMGAVRILGMGRNPDVLAAVAALDARIATFDIAGDGLADRMRDAAGGGAAGMIDCQGRGAGIASTMAAIGALRKGGRAVMIGAVGEAMPLDYVRIMITGTIITGTVWFTTAEGAEMVAMADAGTLDLSIWRTVDYPLEQLNEGLEAVSSRLGGFNNLIVAPSPDLRPE